MCALRRQLVCRWSIVHHLSIGPLSLGGGENNHDSGGQPSPLAWHRSMAPIVNEPDIASSCPRAVDQWQKGGSLPINHEERRRSQWRSHQLTLQIFSLDFEVSLPNLV